MKGSTRPRQLIRLSALAALGLVTVFGTGSAHASPTVKAVAWGCSDFSNWGQCSVPNNLSGVTAVAAGQYYSLALKSDGSVIAWGCGVLGIEGACNVLAGLSGVTRIATGSSHALALKADGTVAAWGKSCSDVYTNFGQCDVAELSGVTAIAAGVSHSLAVLGNGTVVARGCGVASGQSGDHGQCVVPVGLAGVTAVAAGASHSLALRGDGTVVAWGCMGVATDRGQCTVPVGLSGVTAIAAGAAHSLALRNDGTVVAWGCGVDDGQCAVPVGLSGVTAIAAHDVDSLALRSDGTVVAWGCRASADNGQCSVPSDLSGVAAIAAGRFHSLAVAQLKSQSITFDPLPDRTLGDPDFVVSATASSGLPVSFSVTGNCAISGATVHLTGAGACTVTASQAGDGNYDPGPDVSQTFAIAPPASPPTGTIKAGQSINFAPLPGKTYGDPDFAVSASASSGLAVSFTASGSCTVNGVTVHLTGAGSCTVTASQSGDGNHNAALDVLRTFAISKAGQSISFATLGSKTYGAPDFQLTVTASSGLGVALTATGSCRVTGATVHLTAVGTCTLTASQSGDANYEAATNVSRTFSVARRPCKVPKVVGKRLASARLMIATGHCRTGKVSYAYSQRVKGVVVSQSRRAARVLPAGSRIDLLVSRGPRPKRR
jgi:Regulator of chromosome condensation (RCC1) repeat